MVKFVTRFERLPGVIKAVFIPKRLHLTIFYDESYYRDDIKRRVLAEIRRSNLQESVETISFYEE